MILLLNFIVFSLGTQLNKFQSDQTTFIFLYRKKNIHFLECRPENRPVPPEKRLTPQLQEHKVLPQ